jgi:hypothetical protein
MNEQALHECFNFLRNAPQMAPFREFLENQREQTRDRLETLTDENFLREQGKAQILRTLLGRIEGAPKILEKTKRP